MPKQKAVTEEKKEGGCHQRWDKPPASQKPAANSQQ